VRLPRSLRSFLLQSAVYAVICFSTEIFCGVRHWGYPYNWPAVPISFIFGDFRFFVEKLDAFHTPAIFGPPTLMYPAPLVVSYKIFCLFPESFIHSRSWTLSFRFALIMLMTSWFMLANVRQALVRRGLSPKTATLFVLGVYVLSYPFWFLVHQGNMEFIVWCVITSGLWAAWTEKPWWAAAFFGIATSMKIFPFVFVGLLLGKKQYRQIVFSFAVAAATTVISLWLVCPKIVYSYQQTTAAVAQFRPLYMLQLRPIESIYDHSLFCLIKRALPVMPPPPVVARMLTGYLLMVGIIGVTLYFVRIRKLPLVNQIICLSVAAILLPPTSFDYTLIHLYVPFFLMVFVALDASRLGLGNLPSRGQAIMFALFAIILSPQSEFITHGVGYGAQIKGAALLALWITALIVPFPVAHPQLGAGATEEDKDARDFDAASAENRGDHQPSHNQTFYTPSLPSSPQN